jgi:hypothetical protein
MNRLRKGIVGCEEQGHVLNKNYEASWCEGMLVT